MKSQNVLKKCEKIQMFQIGGARFSIPGLRIQFQVGIVFVDYEIQDRLLAFRGQT